MKTVDTDASGYLDFSEFMVLATEKSLLLTKDNLEKAFCALDIDRNGQLSIKELEAAFGTCCNKKSTKFWKEFIKDIDSDQSGEVKMIRDQETMNVLLETITRYVNERLIPNENVLEEWGPHNPFLNCGYQHHEVSSLPSPFAVRKRRYRHPFRDVRSTQFLFY